VVQKTRATLEFLAFSVVEFRSEELSLDP
jgi:hypothetical protein